MLRFYHLFFLNFAIVAFITLLLFAFSSYFDKQKYKQSAKDEILKHQKEILIPLLKEYLKDGNSDYLPILIALKDRGISIEILKSGETLFSNHSNSFKSLRHKMELDVDTVAFVAFRDDYIESPFIDDFGRFLLFFLLSLLLAVFISYMINLRITSELVTIKGYVLSKIKKDDTKEFYPSYFKEFEEIFFILEKAFKKIERRERKYKKKSIGLRLRNRQNSEIISVISHEFKNPIAIIMGYSETLKDDKSINSNIRDKFLDKIYFNSVKLTDLIDKLSLNAKLESDSLVLKKEHFSLKESVMDVKNMLLEKHKNREIEIVGEEREAFGDKTLIEVVLSNLIDNALKYSQDRVVVNIENERVSVEDFGIGLTRDELSLVTKKYYRVDKNSWNSSLGVGLSIVAYILKLHNLNFNIESQYNKGSTFSFEI